MTKSEELSSLQEQAVNEEMSEISPTKQYHEHVQGRSKRYYMLMLLLLPFALIIGAMGIVRYKSSPYVIMPSLSDNALYDDVNNNISSNNNVEEKLQLETRSLAAQICTLEFISSKEGRIMCETVCENNEEYEPCRILDNTVEIRELRVQTRDASKTYQDKLSSSCSQDSLKVLYLKRLCNQLCSPSACCFTNDKCLSNENNFCPLYNDCQALFDLDVKGRKSNKKGKNKKGKNKK